MDRKNSIHDLVRRMGGATQVARKMRESTGINLTQQAVYRWGARGRIPRLWVSHLCVAYPMFGPEIAGRVGV